MEMRRKDRRMPETEAMELLKNCGECQKLWRAAEGSAQWKISTAERREAE